MDSFSSCCSVSLSFPATEKLHRLGGQLCAQDQMDEKITSRANCHQRTLLVKAVKRPRDSTSERHPGF
eukprot:7663917-Pyramimonas_sp.AAC.1